MGYSTVIRTPYLAALSPSGFNKEKVEVILPSSTLPFAH